MIETNKIRFEDIDSRYGSYGNIEYGEREPNSLYTSNGDLIFKDSNYREHTIVSNNNLRIITLEDLLDWYNNISTVFEYDIEDLEWRVPMGTDIYKAFDKIRHRTNKSYPVFLEERIEKRKRAWKVTKIVEEIDEQ